MDDIKPAKKTLVRNTTIDPDDGIGIFLTMSYRLEKDKDGNDALVFGILCPEDMCEMLKRNDHMRYMVKYTFSEFMNSVAGVV